jgi:hypothetical protein
MRISSEFSRLFLRRKNDLLVAAVLLLLDMDASIVLEELDKTLVCCCKEPWLQCLSDTLTDPGKT